MKKTNKTQAIKEKCEDCIYDPLAGGTNLMQIEKCSQPACPLYQHRPLTSATKKVNQQAAYELMTPEQKAKFDAKSKAAAERFAKAREEAEEGS